MKKILSILVIAEMLLFTACNKNTKNTKDAMQNKIDEKLFDKGVLTPELLWKLGRLSDIKLSPDKKTILYGITYYDLEKNKGNRDLYTIPVKKGTPDKITDSEDNEANGIWRPDGKKIGFLSSKNGSSQIWEMNPDGTDKKQISDIKGDISSFIYSPNANYILFIKNVKLDKTVADVYPDLPLANARIIDDLMYRHWNAWANYSYTHIFIASYKNGLIETPVDIMENEHFNIEDINEINWSPDEKSIVYACKKLKGKEFTLSTNSDIYIYNIETKNTKNISKNMLGYDKSPVFSTNGKKIVWRSMKTPGFEADKDRIILYDCASKEIKDLSENFDQSSSKFQWSKNNAYIYFISGINATYQLYSVNIKTNKITQITKGIHNYTSFQLADNYIIGTKMSMSLPSEIFKIDKNTGNEQQLSFTNKYILDKITLANVEERWVKTTDNKKMLTWVIYPPNFDKTKKYPALLYCQGGPQSAVSQFFSYRWNFQIMAANNYIIVAPNRRGLPTFGQEWNDQISQDYGGQNMKDYISAIDSLAKEPFIDQNKLGSIGASYGGFSVFWLAGHNNNKRFKAFISHCGNFNFESWYGSTDEMWFPNHDLGGSYFQKNRPKSYDFSPHNFIANWNTPILIITSANDFRIPETEGMQAFNCAQLRDIPSRLVYFPDESHFILKPQNAVLWQRIFFEWLDKWLK